MKYPVGRSMRALGLRPPRTYLQDPVRVFNSAIAPMHLLPLLERVLTAVGYFNEAVQQTGRAVEYAQPI